MPLLTIISCSPERVHIDDTQENKEAQMLFYQGKPFTGIAYDVYSNGQLQFEETYKDGELNGLYQEWYENGQLASQGTFKDNELNGLFQEWDKNGQFLEEQFYDN